MNGNDKVVWDTQGKDVLLKMQGHFTKLDFQVMNMTRADVVLGTEWLHGLGTSLARSYQSQHHFVHGQWGTRVVDWRARCGADAPHLYS